MLPSHFDKLFQVLLASPRKEVSQEPFKKYQTLQATGTCFLKNPPVSSINSRRRKLALITYFQDTFLTAPVAWSIFHGKTAALKSDFNLCSYSLYFIAPQRLQILQAPRLQNWDLRYLDPRKGMSDLWMIQEQKAMPKLLKVELGPRKSQHLQLPGLQQYFQAPCPAPTCEAPTMWNLLWGLPSTPVCLMRNRRCTPYI